jgi:predicted Zn-dependent protease
MSRNHYTNPTSAPVAPTGSPTSTCSSPGRGKRAARGWSAGLLALPLVVMACAINPVTGDRQLALISESQEIAMGQEYDPQIVAQMGLYPDSSLQQYVRGLGMPMARASERPDLPWTFRVLDDPLVNAFAVPGGFIYLTRGILAHMGSEAELVGILGHEIGHVTARHSVNQMSRQQLAQLGLGVGMILRPELQQFGDLAGAGLGLLFLKYGRDAEYQSDDLGVRYMTEAGYDPRQLASVFRTLSAMSGDGEGGRPPEWASTHPFPENREDRVLASVSAAEVAGLRVGRDEFVQRLDGIIFGENPREGFFRDNVFLHPELAFRLDFPSGWRTQNTKSAVMGMSGEQDTAVQLDLAPQGSASAARDAFLSSEGLQPGERWNGAVNGLPGAWAEFSVAQEGGNLRGVAGFVEYGGRVYRLLGYGTPDGWQARGGSVRSSLESFQRVTDQGILGVQPRRLEIVRLPSAMDFQEFLRRYPSTEEPGVVALINSVGSGERLEAGRLMKRVVGSRP